MERVISSDGTTIAYESRGEGPVVVLVDGALCYRDSGPNGPLAEQLASRFTVITYDRRGRGDSGDTQPYAIEREVEDLRALIDVAGGAASVYGISSGAVLVLEAANRGLPIAKMALYEAPFIVDDTREPVPADYAARMDELIASERRADAVRLFMSQGVGLPRFVVAMMRLMPAWKKLKGVAHTLPYDTALASEFQRGTPLPRDRWTTLAPVLVIDGGKSHAWMRNGMRQLADTLPNARYQTLEGQTHIVAPKVLAPVLEGFFTD